MLNAGLKNHIDFVNIIIPLLEKILTSTEDGIQAISALTIKDISKNLAPTLTGKINNINTAVNNFNHRIEDEIKANDSAYSRLQKVVLKNSVDVSFKIASSAIDSIQSLYAQLATITATKAGVASLDLNGEINKTLDNLLAQIPTK